MKQQKTKPQLCRRRFPRFEPALKQVGALFRSFISPLSYDEAFTMNENTSSLINSVRSKLGVQRTHQDFVLN